MQINIESKFTRNQYDCTSHMQSQHQEVQRNRNTTLGSMSSTRNWIISVNSVLSSVFLMDFKQSIRSSNDNTTQPNHAAHSETTAQESNSQDGNSKQQCYLSKWYHSRFVTTESNAARSPRITPQASPSCNPSLAMSEFLTENKCFILNIKAWMLYQQ